MTIDERLEFLLKSTESLHETVQKNTDQIADLGTNMQALGTKVDGLADRVNSLLGIMNDLARLARNHEERLQKAGL